MVKKVEVSHKTIIFTVFFLLFLFFLYFIRDIILQFFLALLLMAILDPAVKNLSRRGIPKTFSILATYIIVLGGLFFVIATIVPTVFDQTTQFVNKIPHFIENLGLTGSGGEKVLDQAISQMGTLPSQLAKFTVSLLSNILGVVTILVLAFYLLSERDKLDNMIEDVFGISRGREIENTIGKIEYKMGGWARGELLLMFVIGLANYIGFKLLGIPFALPLAILAGMFEIIPYIGPILAAIPAVLIGFGLSPFTGVATIALGFLIQQLENYLLVPKIMQKSVGVSPIVTLLALAVGFRLAGIAGLLISVPVFILFQILFKQYFSSKGN